MTPDMYVLLAATVAVAAEFVVPIGEPPGLLAPLTWVGIVIALAGFSLEIGAARALARGGTTAKAGGEPTALVTTGLFARSRNPFYLGLLLVLAGLLLALGLEWGLLCTSGVWLALDRDVVPREETKLKAAFPEDYARYAQSVRRWL